MSNIKIDIKGVEGVMKTFDMLPDNILKMEKESLKVAARETAKHIRKGIPKRFKKLVKFKVYDRGPKGTYALMGLYNRHERQGEQSNGGDPVFDWFKAYWANYGTLKRRDPNHKFKYKVKPKKEGDRRRQSVGQPAQKFFENALNGWQEICMEKFETAFKQREDQLYNKV